MFNSLLGQPRINYADAKVALEYPLSIAFLMGSVNYEITSNCIILHSFDSL